MTKLEQIADRVRRHDLESKGITQILDWPQLKESEQSRWIEQVLVVITEDTGPRGAVDPEREDWSRRVWKAGCLEREQELHDFRRMSGSLRTLLGLDPDAGPLDVSAAVKELVQRDIDSEGLRLSLDRLRFLLRLPESCDPLEVVEAVRALVARVCELDGREAA